MSSARQSPKTLRSDARALVQGCAGWNSRLAARRITQFLDRELAGTGLSVGPLGLMAQIAVVESDLRRRAVWLTETGARRLEAAIPLWRKAHTKLAKVLSTNLARRLADQAETLGEA